MVFLHLAFSLFLGVACKNSDSSAVPAPADSMTIRTGAMQTELWLPLLRDKKVACVVNQTTMLNKVHLVDTMISLGIQVKTIFAPEHGFRGTEDAGASISDSKDADTGIPLISLYGNKKKPKPEDLDGIEVIVFDIQDVGARFYTYISTLHYIMEACAEQHIPLIILDRPNPNGFYVDGPVLEKNFSSFIGMHPVPIVHGMTIGEYAKMINGEGWLANKARCDLQVVPCANYDHKKFHTLDIPPSPNLRTMKAIYLYPSLCLFEGTNVSVGRGTERPFEVIGSPYLPQKTNDTMSYPTVYSFVPKSSYGSKSPVFMDQNCYGWDFGSITTTMLRDDFIRGAIQLDPLINAYQAFSDPSKFFLENNVFNKLAGNAELMQQIKAGLTEEEIRLSWQDDLNTFKKTRSKYLLYSDFE